MSSKKCDHCSSQKEASNKIRSHAPKAFFFPNPQQFRETCQPQEFSFRMPLINYILTNSSSPKVYENLIKCCKFFFLKYPILITYNLNYSNNEWTYCNVNECGNKLSCTHRHKNVDMDKLKNSKIWVTKRFIVSRAFDVKYVRSNTASNFIPKIYRYNVNILKLISQNLSFDDLKFLAAGVKECYLVCNKITYENGEELLLENIVKVFAGAKNLSMEFNYKPNNSVCKNYDDFIVACQSIEKVELLHILDIFNVSQFYQHLKNSKNRSLIEITSDMDIEGFDEIINEILEIESFEFIPPVLIYPAIDKYKITRLKGIQATEFAKYQ